MMVAQEENVGKIYSSIEPTVYGSHGWIRGSYSSRIASFPPELQDIETAISKSERIAHVTVSEENGDTSYSGTTLKRAQGFLFRTALNSWQRYGVRVQAPVFGPGPDGGIDILWRTGDRELLVTVPANDREPISYYGNDRTHPDAPIRNTVEGIVDISAQNEWLLVWLAQ